MAKADDWTTAARPAAMAMRRNRIAYMTGGVQADWSVPERHAASEKHRLMKVPVDGKGA
jgi:hypothetical protein